MGINRVGGFGAWFFEFFAFFSILSWSFKQIAVS